MSRLAGSATLLFCEDDTSPIGSRAAKIVVNNLDSIDIEQMVSLLGTIGEADEVLRRASEIYEMTGGQAGLSAYLSRALAVDPTADMARLGFQLQAQHSELFTIWRDRLSKEARAVHDELVRRGVLTRADIASLLLRLKMDPFKSDRAREELQFTGIANEHEGRIEATNRLYSDFVKVSAVIPPGTDDELLVWSMIREAEVSLRRLVKEKYADRWGDGSDDKMSQALGRVAWDRILDNLKQSGYQYDRGVQTRDDIMQFTYLGQLGQLMLWGPAWDMFKILFKERRELEEMLRDITPVRNDVAHFRHVPNKELVRCRISCDDILAVIEAARVAEPVRT